MNLKKLSLCLFAALASSAVLAASAGPETLPSGVVIEHKEPGTGPQVTAESVVRLYYDGHTADGKLFSTWWTDKSQPAQFKVAFAQPCFAQGVPRLQVGEAAEIRCPASTVLGAGGVDQPTSAAGEVTYKVRIVSIKGQESGTQ
jgi:FKBP-type peptidyl-prolyl cis-trans isomerase FkpA